MKELKEQEMVEELEEQVTICKHDVKGETGGTEDDGGE